MNLSLRSVKPEDVDLLFGWANDPETRKNSFRSEQIPYEAHKRWFSERLKDEDTRIYICLDGEEPVGQLRLALGVREAEISYSVAPGRRGQGIGTALLRLSEERLKEELPELKLLKGQVKCENLASVKAFEKNGYRRTEREGHLEFIKGI